MAAFDDASDPALRAACNRLAAWVEPMPEGETVDPVSGLTERDLALILRHLYATRHSGDSSISPAAGIAYRQHRASVPITAKD